MAEKEGEFAYPSSCPSPIQVVYLFDGKGMAWSNLSTYPVAGITPPDSSAARDAQALAREASTPMLYNHVMRSYYFAALLGQKADLKCDRELVFLSAVLHDIGLTSHAPGPRRFEIEGADAAKEFVRKQGKSEVYSSAVWDIIALHTLDVNQYRQPEARAVQSGIVADVTGANLTSLDSRLVTEVTAAFPRLNFKQEFVDVLLRESHGRPHQYPFHPVTMVSYHCTHGAIAVPNAAAIIEQAPFDE